MKNIGLSLLIIGLLSGCSNSKENKTPDQTVQEEVKIDKTVSADNFKNVLNAYYVRNCIHMVAGEFPEEVDLTMDWHDYAIKYKTLEKLGFIKAVNKPTVKEAKTKYIITEEGKKHYKIWKHKRYSVSGFCIGNYEIDKITNYTAPKDFRGINVSKVSYTLKVKEEGFVKNIDKTQFKDNLFKYKESDSAELILTEMQGWMNYKEFKRL